MTPKRDDDLAQLRAEVEALRRENRQLYDDLLRLKDLQEIGRLLAVQPDAETVVRHALECAVRLTAATASRYYQRDSAPGDRLLVAQYDPHHHPDPLPELTRVGKDDLAPSWERGRLARPRASPEDGRARRPRSQGPASGRPDPAEYLPLSTLPEEEGTDGALPEGEGTGSAGETAGGLVWRRVPAVGIAHSVLRSGRTVNCDDVSRDRRHGAAAEVTGLNCKCLLAVPVTRRGQVLGVLEVVDCDRGAFDDDDREYLEALAVHTATVLEILRLSRAPAEGEHGAASARGTRQRAPKRKTTLNARR